MKCYLLHSYNVDVSGITQLLRENDVSYFSPFDTTVFTDSFPETILNKLKECDFVVAVLDGSSSSYFELGLIAASKKPFYMVVPESEVKKIPLHLSGSLYTTANPNDYNQLKYSFQIFLEKLPTKKGKKPQSKIKGKSEGKRLTNAEAQILLDEAASTATQAPVEFQRFVGRLFERLNIDNFVSNSSKEKDFQADFSLWIDELDFSIGNPIIIETKASYYDIDSGFQQLLYQISKYNARAGIFLYNSPENPYHRTSRFHFAPLIIALSVQELLNELTTKTFSEIIIERRNFAAHAIDS